LTTATYATVLDLCKFMQIESRVPDPRTTGDRVKENLGSVTTSTTRLFTDYAFVIDGSYTFYYGATETASTNSALTEGTHYTLDKDLGEVQLTDAGTALTGLSGDNNIYGKYSFSEVELTSSQMQDALNRAQAHLDDETNNHWATGTDATPDYNQATNEKHRGKGRFDRNYFTKNYPIPDVSTYNTSEITADDEIIYVNSTNGFPSSGYIAIDGDKITYTGKTTTSFTGCSDITAHSSTALTVTPHVFEISTTEAGSTPSWTVLRPETEYDLDYDSGRVHVYRDDFVLDTYTSNNPPQIPYRFKATYQWGNTTIPDDVKQLCLAIAARDGPIKATLRRNYTGGKTGYDQQTTTFDDEWINKKIIDYRNNKSENI